MPFTSLADMWWRTIKTAFQGSEATRQKFAKALRTKFYPMHLQKQTQREFLTLKREDLCMVEYAGKFTKLSRFSLEYVATDRVSTLRFEEELALYIRNQLAGQQAQFS